MPERTEQDKRNELAYIEGLIEKYSWSKLTSEQAEMRAKLVDRVLQLRTELGGRADGPKTLENFSSQDTRATGAGRDYALGGPGQAKDYRSLFGVARGAGLDRGGFKDFNEYLTVVSTGRYDDRLETRTMGETVPSGGGFAVPEEFAAWLLDSSLESEIVRPRATVWPMKSDTIKVPGWDAQRTPPACSVA